MHPDQRADLDPGAEPDHEQGHAARPVRRRLEALLSGRGVAMLDQRPPSIDAPSRAVPLRHAATPPPDPRPLPRSLERRVRELLRAR